MYRKYVLRANKQIGKCYLEVIKPEESLWIAILGERITLSIKYTVYRDLKTIINQLFDTLTEQEIEVLKYRFGFYGDFCSLREVGKRMGLSGERVRQIEKKALRKLRHPSRSRQLYRVPVREDLLQVPEKTINFKRIIIEKITAYMVGQNSKAGFLINIFEKNELSIVFNDIIGDIPLKDLEFEPRTYNCLWKSGVRSLSDLINMTEEDLMKVRHLDRKGIEEVLNRIRECNIEPIMNRNASNKYISVKVTYKGVEQIYKFKQMTAEEIAECIYEVLAEECSKNGIIIDYEMSFELKYLLLFKGYFFIEKMIEDSNRIVEELTLGMYDSYAEECKMLLEKIKDCMDNESNPEVTFDVVTNKIAKSIINRKPENPEELFECFKTGNDENDECLKRQFIEKYPSDFRIKVDDKISLNEIDEDVVLDFEDEEISRVVDLQDE